jgi:hypothetical protein
LFSCMFKDLQVDAGTLDIQSAVSMKPLHLIDNPFVEGEPKFGTYEELHYVDLWMTPVITTGLFEIFQLTNKDGTEHKVESGTLSEAQLNEWLFKEV